MRVYREVLDPENKAYDQVAWSDHQGAMPAHAAGVYGLRVSRYRDYAAVRAAMRRRGTPVFAPGRDADGDVIGTSSRYIWVGRKARFAGNNRAGT